MRTQFSNFALAAGFGLALAFTFSCSSSDDGDNGQGVSFNENSQVYDEDGSLFTGSGDIILDDEFPMGSVTNGIVHLELPTIPDGDLEDFKEAHSGNLDCTDYPNGIKYYFAEKIVLTNSSNRFIGILRIGNEQYERIYYMYFSKAGKITCNWLASDGGVLKYNLDVKAGWNKIYPKKKSGTEEYSTNNTLIKEVKWIIYSY